MNLKTTIAVLLLAAALGAYLYVVEIGRKDGDSDTPTVEAGEALFDKDRIAADKVTKVRIELPGSSKAATFERATVADPWRQTEPVEFAATEWAVGRVIDLVSGLRFTSTFAPADKKLTAEQLGLAPPRGIVTVGGEGVERVTVAIGRAPAAGIAYAVVGYKPDQAIDKVYVVGDALHTELAADAIDRFRSKTLAAVSGGAADQVTLTRDGATIKLVKREGSWSLVEPVTDRAGREGVERLIGAFGAATIEQFTADKPKDLSTYGLDKPTRVLTVHTSSPAAAPAPGAGGEPPTEPAPAKTQTHTLTIGSATGLNAESYYAMTDGKPVVFTIAKAAAERLDSELDGLRDPRLAASVKADVTGLTIKHADGQAVAFVRDQGVWKFGEPAPAFSLDGDLLGAAIDALFAARAERFDAVADDAPAPVATIELSRIGRTEPTTLAVRDAGEGKVAVTLGGEKTARVIDRAAIAQLLSPATAYRDRTIIGQTTDQVAKVHVKRTGRWPAEYTIDRAPPKAQGPSPDGGEDDATAPAEPWRFDGLDRAAALTLVARIAPLRAEGWLDGPLPADAKNLAAIDVTFVDGTSKRLTIDYTHGHGMVDGVDTAFALPEGDAEVFAAELADRLVLKLSVDDIASIAGEGWSVKRNADGRFTLEGDGKLDEPVAAALFDGAANLTAEHFVPAAPDGAAAATLTLTTHDGKTHTIGVWPAAAEGEALTPTPPATLKVDDRVFTVAPAVAKRLSGKPVVESK